MPNSTNVRKKDALSPALFVADITAGRRPLDAPPQNTPIDVIASVQDTLVAGCAVAREPAPMGGVQEKAAQAPSQARSWACLHNSARSAATTATGRGCAHTAAELQRGGAPHPPTGVWPHASDAVAVDMQRSAGCSTVQRRLRHHAGRLKRACSSGCDPCNPTHVRCSWPSTQRATAASRPHAPPCRLSRWSGAHGPGLRRRLRQSGSSRPCSHRSLRPRRSRHHLLWLHLLWLYLLWLYQQRPRRSRWHP